jgi:hypothetical protein
MIPASLLNLLFLSAHLAHRFEQFDQQGWPITNGKGH